MMAERGVIMAHKIAEMIDSLSGEPIPCNEKCKYWKFPHLERPCVLSSVYSVLRGEPCGIFQERDCISVYPVN